MGTDAADGNEQSVSAPVGLQSVRLRLKVEKVLTPTEVVVAAIKKACWLDIARHGGLCVVCLLHAVGARCK